MDGKLISGQMDGWNDGQMMGGCVNGWMDE